MKTKVLILIGMVFFSASAFTQIFSDEFTGIDSIQMNSNYPAIIRTFYNDGDSVLYISGHLSYVNGNSVAAIFSWDTEEITTYPSGNIFWLDDPVCIAKYNNYIYVGGGLIEMQG